MKSLKDKTVLITGGASGIGKLMGQLVLQKGAKLIIWDINPHNIEQTMADLSGYGKVAAYQVDVSLPEQIRATAAMVKQQHGIVDVLINNAGIVVGKYFHEHTYQDIGKTMDINADAPMYVTLEFLPGMLAQNSGHICNIASSGGLISNPKMSVYVASKWSVIGWSDSLRIEMQQLKKNVGVTTVMPYYINTGMFDGVRSVIPILKPEKVARKVIRAIEQNRIFLGMPWSIHFVRFSQGIMPVRLFDWFVGGVLGIYKTMEHFKGRKQ
ncbi:SDR family oxidoreductase [Pontibacter cellulosilyticus]|uniref:SDR family oxidoreductase n=1 Tax=Pontibacter cellulosilyticus TaxID=1720253 RepID=A0A923N8V1_9BACT|nr:SDR family oxidoreductase [Pontibacter cellulosilyticus]MBC5994338.1 SDR family oxidoreductase [Pontibacter cellulosilyticus]